MTAAPVPAAPVPAAPVPAAPVPAAPVTAARARLGVLAALFVLTACSETRLVDGDTTATGADSGTIDSGVSDTLTGLDTALPDTEPLSDADDDAPDSMAPDGDALHGGDGDAGDGGAGDGSAGDGGAGDGGAEDADAMVLDPPLAPRTCTQRFEYDSFGQTFDGVFLAGEFNGWVPDSTPMTLEAGTWAVDLDTTGITGTRAYKFVTRSCPGVGQPCVDDWHLDPAQPMQKIVDGQVNSKAVIADCTLPLLEVETLTVQQPTANTAGRIEVVVAVREGATVSGLEQPSVRLRGTALSPAELAEVWNAGSQRFVVVLEDLPAGKHSLTFDIANANGPAERLYLPLWLDGDEAFEWDDAVLYFAMTDRFADGDPAVGGPSSCLPADNKANWQGGDWAGVRQKIESGYFSDLGVTAIWLTAVVDNPNGCFTGQLGKQYTSYHGYFPSAQTTPEDKLGSLEDLQAMVNAAHERGIRVLVDLVANHLHSEHPLVNEQPGWFHGYFQCGFDEAPISCWFESYLPDLNYEDDGAVEAMTDAAVWWVQTADFDGFRIDAVKHMHDNFLLTLRQKLKERVETTPGAVFYTVGETFTGGWGGGSGSEELLIKKYVSPTLLHGQFDFPMFWVVLNFFGRNAVPATALVDVLEGVQGFYGPQAIMSNFLGNHDVPRFISHAAEDIGDLFGGGSKEQGWDNPPPAPDTAEPYQRLQVAFSFLLTIPGIPLIYYGDEIGMPGAGDPDNRRPMFFTGWTSLQQGVYDHVGKLAKLRAELPALRRGTYQTAHAGNQTLAYVRTTAEQSVLVALNPSSVEQTITVGNLPNGTWLPKHGADTNLTVSGTSATLVLPPWTTTIYLKQ